jgi:signal transduction histidine kinase
MVSARPARIVPWVTGAVYAIVLLAGLYYVLAGLGTGAHQPARVIGFVAGIALLFALEQMEVRRPVSRRGAAGFLLARLVLFFAVAALDESSLSRALFVLVPFAAYLTFGRRAGLVLGGLCLALLVAGFAVWVPGWYRDANYVSDLLMFGLGLVMAIAMADVVVREARSAARVAELSVATERNRMARDIHDSLGHHLTAISVQLEKASAFRDRDPAVAEQAVTDARQSARRALEDVRTSVGALRTPVSLRAALAGLDVPVSVEGTEQDTDPATVTALYRAAQEAVTNARRHGEAGRVAVSVRFGALDTRLVVTDDGRGFRPGEHHDTGHEHGTGFGLLGLRERAALVGGVVEIDSEPGAGTRVAVTVPRRAAERS